MRFIEINVNAGLIDALKGIKTGETRDFIDYGEIINNKDKLIHHISGLLQDSGFKFVGIETKYNFGKRHKRIEIVFGDHKDFNLVKFAKMHAFDKEALEMSVLINDIHDKYRFKVRGIIVLTDQQSNELTRNFTEKLGNDILILGLDEFKESYGLFN